MDLHQKRRLDAAELGELCLAYLAENPELLAQFMGYAGYDPTGLRAAVGSPSLATGLIDYFASNEPLMLTFCAKAGLRPEDFMRVYYKLNPGG